MLFVVFRSDVLPAFECLVRADEGEAKALGLAKNHGVAQAGVGMGLSQLGSPSP